MRLTRRERIKLLLRTYNDAFGEDKSEGGFGRLESRVLGHGELWHQGSYGDVQRGLEALKEKAPSVHWHTVELFVCGRKARNHKAELGVSFLMKRLPSNVYVPQEIAENAGYPASEAKAASRPRVKAAA